MQNKVSGSYHKLFRNNLDLNLLLAKMTIRTIGTKTLEVLYWFLPKTTSYVKIYDGQTKWMYFLTEDDDLFSHSTDESDEK